ncbi:HupE/UreJ family protein [Paenibacillus andongensis]|uniref:HupE/UreJ family protein n=1 Tax=Paenibacillus andongensis TaxID=2975482 RepID=UPI0021BB7523|nr:HupE/UreJ family protein [Paenibacillus andongensis]
MKKYMLAFSLPMLVSLLSAVQVYAHGVDNEDAELIAREGSFYEKMFDFLWLGTKHMLTGYDHLLFILGIVFLLANFRDVVKYISYFTIGHSITLIIATLAGITFNYYIVDAIIGLSVLYKGYDNLFDAKTKFKIPFDMKWIIFAFGLVHGFGLSTRLQALHLPENNLFAYIMSFNVGVEIGQIIVLAVFVWALNYYRKHQSFNHFKIYANQGLIGAGVFLFLVGIINAILN